MAFELLNPDNIWLCCEAAFAFCYCRCIFCQWFIRHEAGAIKVRILSYQVDADCWACYWGRDSFNITIDNQYKGFLFFGDLVLCISALFALQRT